MPVATRERHKMTPEEATSFSRFSIYNAAQAMKDLRESGVCRGDCDAYRDIYTYKRWQAQGYQVRRGQHGAKLSIIIQTEKEDKEGNTIGGSMPWATTVFCRCQVDIKGASAANTDAR